MDQPLDGLPVPGVVGEDRRRAGGRPAGHDDRPVGVVAGVDVLEERRPGGQGEQGRQPAPDPLDQADGQVGVGHTDLYLAGTDLLLGGELAVLVGDPAVPVVGVHGGPAGTGVGHRARRGHP